MYVAVHLKCVRPCIFAIVVCNSAVAGKKVTEDLRMIKIHRNFAALNNQIKLR